ncbi:MAG TPA: hypothetical protein VFC51_05670 [Chloroflexota bacterium]|nr:hypothetical protein [Chloroflexota bacterium]
MRLRARLGRLRIRARAAEEDRSWNAEAGLGGAFLAALLLLAPPAAAPAASAQASRAAPASLQTQWTREGLPDHFVYHLAADPTRPGRLYAYGGLFGGKGRNTNMNLFRSDDGGQWENISQGNVGSIFAGGLAVDDSGVVYVSDSHSIHISRDGGSAWETVSGPPGDRALAVVPTEPPTLYTVGGLTGFARSTDGGVTWDLIDRQLLCDATSLAADAAAPSTVYLAGACGVLRSKWGGTNWSLLLSVSLGSNAYLIPYIALNPSDPSVLYVGGYNGYSPDDPAVQGLWRSRDGGVSWDHVNSEFPIKGLRFDERDPSHQTLLALGDRELFWSADGGATWASLRGPPASVTVFPHDFIASGDRVVVATNGDGIWSAPLPPLPPLP